MDDRLRINIEMLRFDTDEIIEMGIPNKYNFWKNHKEGDVVLIQNEYESWEDFLETESELGYEANEPDCETNEPDQQPAAEPVSVDLTPLNPAPQPEYWEGFSRYADNYSLNPAMTMAKLADRTWQALHMRPSFLTIECSFSVRKNSIWAAFIVKGHPKVFAQAQRVREEIDRELQGYDIAWDGESSAANISLTASMAGMSTSEQYEWFCRAAEALYEAVRPRLDV